MSNIIRCVMLIDDNPDDNFFHEREIKKSSLVDTIIIKNTGQDALEYIKSEKSNNGMHPELIFLDINMPGMNGWEFLREYDQLDKELQSRVVIIMLTTSDNPDDKLKANEWSFVSDFRTKPLTKEMLKNIVESYFGYAQKSL